eukprot:3896462-Rhodomonas_salina.1
MSLVSLKLSDDQGCERDRRKDPNPLRDEDVARSTPCSSPSAARHSVNPDGTRSWVPRPEQRALAVVLVREQI